MFEKNVVEATFDLQFKIIIVMVQKGHHQIFKISIEAIDLLLVLMQFSLTKQW